MKIQQWILPESQTNNRQWSPNHKGACVFVFLVVVFSCRICVAELWCPHQLGLWSSTKFCLFHPQSLLSANSLYWSQESSVSSSVLSIFFNTCKYTGNIYKCDWANPKHTPWRHLLVFICNGEKPPRYQAIIDWMKICPRTLIPNCQLFQFILNFGPCRFFFFNKMP